MSNSSDDYVVGYRRPPKEHEWKKGQCGNPNRQRIKPVESALEYIDRLLIEPIQITTNGEKRVVPAISAIAYQLSQKVLANNKRAARLLAKFCELARQSGDKRLQIVFVESDYTKALSGQPAETEDGDEGR